MVSSAYRLSNYLIEIIPPRFLGRAPFSFSFTKRADFFNLVIFTMVRSQRILITGFSFSLIGFGLSGCGSKPVSTITPATEQLRAIGIAYAKATIDMERPPTKKEELYPFFKKADDPDNSDNPKQEQNPADYFRSLSDGEEFVIDWGFDIRKIAISAPPKKMPVIAYEKKGVDGKRYILQVRYVSHVTDEELADLPFPKGFKGP